MAFRADRGRSIRGRLSSLTTIRPPARAMGEVAALRILQRLGELPMGDDGAGRLNLLPCELIERESA